MDRKGVDSALNGVDSKMLELLSDQYLYPTGVGNNESNEAVGNKPRGRPAFVPGAMKSETMKKFQERKAQEYRSQQNGQQNEPIRKSKKKVKGSSADSTDGNEPKDTDSTTSIKKKKRVVKNLPERKANEKKPISKGRKVLKGRAKANNLELQKYYRTELLTAAEEYELGLKVQLMVKCEQVHEGLAIQNMRLPTFHEWAEACGYDSEDPNFVVSPVMENIRPAGSEEMFQEVDPMTFVGNGLAHSVGPGRGRGRQKEPAPSRLKAFYDEKKRKKGKDARERINQGTTTEFVEMMLDAKEAKQTMVQSNMRLVVSIARKYSNVGVNLQDLVQEGSLGLSRAAEKFDPSKGFKFSTYASWWIQQAVFRSIAYHSRTVRLPVHVHNLLNRVRKVRTQLQSELGRAPTDEELADAMDMSLSKYKKMLRLTRRSISLEEPKYKSNPKDLGHESDDLLGDTVSTSGVTEDELSSEKLVDRSLFHDDLRGMLEILDEDERKVIRYRYGLADGLTRTVTAVAAEMKQSKAWVRSLECKALRKLRRPWYEKKLKEHQESLSS